ncbi:RNA polymerase sigma-70 factor [Maribacter polysiphoniae]|uniref:RNA polymerase sigma-70 factor n=1 Tax=Maribacter polysiphoniae TaxID=429344 RepID=A0A316DZ86_9FLAO|nr:RNA polymerase sigma-70 factor [Maribacter polysiphoniae]MBD1261648.1 RNA polymerase sigma-70 factor [Maribacter polysiphoniae]PWK22549.1 RNA polymerase sigma-70 factor (ECF subfamily) [Maribacter polysiphoniae]
MAAKLNDSDLLELMVLDDVSAFEEIYERYSKSMFLFAMNIFKKKEVCEDIVQNVFIDFWAKRKKANVKQLKPYLFQAVKYQVFNHIRNRKISDEDLTRLIIVDISMSISQKLEFDELQAIIKIQVDKLPTKCQQIFVLSRFQDKSNKEIALELGISVQAVKNQISKALAFLRKNMVLEEGVLYLLFLTSTL